MRSSEEEQWLLPDSRDVVEQRQGRIPSALRFRNRKANPYWLIPVVLTVYMSRGVTMAPRIQVYEAIACRSLRGGPPTSTDTAFQTFMDCSGSDVAARAAKIQAAVITIMNILSAVTTGFWSRLGDAYGRKPIFYLYLMGAMFMELVFVIAMKPNTIFGRRGERFILLGPIVEGLLGGNPTLSGLLHAYISDCTRNESRSKIFSTIHGILFIGLSAGPWLARLIIPVDASTDPFFYVSVITLLVTLLYALAILPESRRGLAQADSHCCYANREQTKTPTLALIHGYLLKFLAALLSPIVMFAPRPLKSHPKKRTYILTFLGLAYFVHVVSSGLYGTRYVFSQHLYSWTTTQLGRYMSLLWIFKAINLLVVLPMVISYFKPKTKTGPESPLSPLEVAAELRFDKNLTIASLALDGAVDLLVALTSRNSEIIFLVLSCASSFTSGSDPAFHSLGAICLHACGYGSEVGTLFGAKAVLGAVAHIISPTIFATTYAATVAYFPQAIFILAAVLISISAMLVACIQHPVKDAELAYVMNAEGQSLSEDESL